MLVFINYWILHALPSGSYGIGFSLKFCMSFFFSFLQNPFQFTTKKSVDSLYGTSSRRKWRQVTYYSYRRQTGDLTHMDMEFQRNCARIARLRSTLNQHFRPMLPVILFARSTNCKYSKCKCLHDNNYVAPVTSQIQHGLSENHACNIAAGLLLFVSCIVDNWFITISTINMYNVLSYIFILYYNIGYSVLHKTELHAVLFDTC